MGNANIQTVGCDSYPYDVLVASQEFVRLVRVIETWIVSSSPGVFEVSTPHLT